MKANNEDFSEVRSGAINWLVRVNGQVSQWAASMSWWRLIVLFLLILIAGTMIGSLLHLQHDRVYIARPSKDPSATVAGRDGAGNTVPPRPAMPGPSGAPGPSSAAPESHPNVSPVEQAVNQALESAVKAAERATANRPVGPAADSDDGVKATVRSRVITFGGILGDLGDVLLVVLFAYLAGSKIVVRKVAQADAKVRTAVDAAEREAMERQLVQARLQVLQAQVEPHFLFNTLAAVDYLIETEPPRASQMQKALITYLRGALPQMRQESSTLGREMRLIRSYLDLIKMRIEDRLQVEIAVPELLESAQFPPMMLQSLVENAVKHGIEPKTDGGKVRVAAGTASNTLWVEVSDTGVGVPEGDLFEAPTSGCGIGLQNIRERLSMLYPGKSRLLLRSDPATGTVVRISVPLVMTAPEPAQAAGAPSGKPA